VIKGQPPQVLPKLFEEWNITHLTFEEDPEPHGKEKDRRVKQQAVDMNVKVIIKTPQTLPRQHYTRSKHLQNTPKHIQTHPKHSKKDFKHTFKTHPKHLKNIIKTLQTHPKHKQNTAKTLSRHC
jgi:deoxyribodipyrimidine photolyase